MQHSYESLDHFILKTNKILTLLTGEHTGSFPQNLWVRITVKEVLVKKEQNIKDIESFAYTIILHR